MRFALLIVMLALGGCATNPEGSNWGLADLNKYGKNYAPFPTDRLQIGMPKAAVVAMFGGSMQRVAAEPTAETFVVERWVSVAGPDYVGERLFLRIDRDRLANWKIDQAGQSTVMVVPRSW